MKSITVKAFAKINLSLEITGREKNGFHSLATVMQSVSLCDTLNIKTNDLGEIRLFCSEPDIPLDEKNTAYKAAKAILEIQGNPNVGLDINIEKNIPQQAGMAGGSADCAAVLAGANKLLELGLSKERLCEEAAKIGSDTAFCVCGGCMLCKGRGEIMQPVSGIDALSEYGIVIIKPDASVSTPWAYSEYDKLEKPLKYDTNAFLKALESKNINEISSLMFNAFEEVTNNRPEFKEIENARNALIKSGALGAMMTGSGSAVFAIFKSQEAALTAAEVLKAEFSKVYTAAGMPNGLEF